MSIVLSDKIHYIQTIEIDVWGWNTALNRCHRVFYIILILILISSVTISWCLDQKHFLPASSFSFTWMSLSSLFKETDQFPFIPL